MHRLPPFLLRSAERKEAGDQEASTRKEAETGTLAPLCQLQLSELPIEELGGENVLCGRDTLGEK